MNIVKDLTKSLCKTNNYLLELLSCILNDESLFKGLKPFVYYDNRDIDYKNYLMIVKDEISDNKACAINTYFKLFDKINWFVIAKDFKETCIAEFKHKNLNISKLETALNHVLEVFTYIIEYISKDSAKIKENNYLYGYYSPTNSNNKILNLKLNSNKSEACSYLYSPNPLLVSSDFLYILNHVKEVAKKSKIILFAIDNSKENCLGNPIEHLKAANYYLTKPKSAFIINKIDKKNKEILKTYFEDSSDLKNKDDVKIENLGQNIELVSLKCIKSYDILLKYTTKVVIYSVKDKKEIN